MIRSIYCLNSSAAESKQTNFRPIIMEKPENAASNPQRRILQVAITQMLLEKGFDSVEKEALETLTEMWQSLLVETGQSSRNYCELAGRTIPVVGDVVIALINMGISLKNLDTFAKREGRQVIPMPTQSTQTKNTSLLQAGTKSSAPPHVPNYLPVFPDPHAYVRTPTHKQPVTEYEAIREKAANQKRDIERALTKFLAKTTETQSLFDTKDNMFPLISCKPAYPAYYAALNPTDQVFDFEELEYHYLVANRTEDCTAKDDDDNESGNEGDEEESPKPEVKQESAIKPISTTNKAILENPNVDNPYLRAAALPKRNNQELPPIMKEMLGNM